MADQPLRNPYSRRSLLQVILITAVISCICQPCQAAPASSIPTDSADSMDSLDVEHPLLIVTYATKVKRGLCDSLLSAAGYGHEMIVLGYGEKWKGFASKVGGTLDFTRTLTGSEIVIFHDAYDVHHQADANTIRSRFLRFQKEWKAEQEAKGVENRGSVLIFGAEKACWPRDIPPCQKETPWPFDNLTRSADEMPGGDDDWVFSERHGRLRGGGARGGSSRRELLEEEGLTEVAVLTNDEKLMIPRFLNSGWYAGFASQLRPLLADMIEEMLRYEGMPEPPGTRSKDDQACAMKRQVSGKFPIILDYKMTMVFNGFASLRDVKLVPTPASRVINRRAGEPKFEYRHKVTREFPAFMHYSSGGRMKHAFILVGRESWWMKEENVDRSKIFFTTQTGERVAWTSVCSKFYGMAFEESFDEERAEWERKEAIRIEKEKEAQEKELAAGTP
eukprot:TRINITY_DN736_c0_g4_i1.p1 TRINITY_DN736_c0_g4~~TRINITY_DN736_c0_g4_i1.p1  ORF type:complete len:448 (-),score=20.33 TRINITY_DN736_c0_g4_i1:992-2335(-)